MQPTFEVQHYASRFKRPQGWDVPSLREAAKDLHPLHSRSLLVSCEIIQGDAWWLALPILF